MMDFLRTLLSNKYFRLAMLSLLVLIIAYNIVLFLAYGRLEIKTNNKTNTIGLYETKKSGEIVKIKQSQGRLNARLKAGTYRVAVENKTFGKKLLVSVKARQKTVKTINLSVGTTVEPVLPDAVSGVVATSNQLKYLDTADGFLYKLTPGNAPASFSQTQRFNSIKWADFDFGIAQGVDGRLYKVNGEQVSPLDVPFTYSDSAEVRYSVANDRMVYVSSGNKIYGGNNGEGFAQVFQSKFERPGLVAGKKALAVFDLSDEKKPGEDSQGEHLLTVINRTGKPITKELGGYEIAWSPDGSKLAVSGDVTNAIYDNYLNEISPYPDGNGNALVWQNDNTLLYGVDSSLWGYNFKEKDTSVVAKMPLGGAVSEIFLSQDGSYIYVSATKNSKSSSYALSRVGLLNQPVSVDGQLLNIYFPTSVGDCEITYANLGQPVLITQNLPDSSGSCGTAAISELKSYDLNPAKYKVIITGPAVVD